SQVQGANFGLSAVAYQAVGGFPRARRPRGPRTAGCAGAGGGRHRPQGHPVLTTSLRWDARARKGLRITHRRSRRLRRGSEGTGKYLALREPAHAPLEPIQGSLPTEELVHTLPWLSRHVLID